MNPQLGVRLTTHLLLLPKFRMSGTLPPLCLYPFVVCTETTLPVTVNGI
jgi:hypothetical protein